ncbi:hemerythrin domain-containing protein [Actinomadura sp. PM05-2]|uniref:Hemerythrin domain-containing protein n=2 Tax=Actinomadura parmotrematis TaxID=2864039 RepID=A0ABS7G407_9ACTN|nr:hemerythrin domain-containing protein [Actinomadura parmotrematis]
MVVIHRGLRRESRVLAEQIGAVRDGDRARARVLAKHLRDYLIGLHHHHTGEDDLIWPLLLSRVDLGADVVLRMEAQHEKVAASIDAVRDAAARWRGDAAGRDALVAALRAHRAVLVEHLDDEEANLLPLAERHLTAAEWDAQGEHFAKAAKHRALLLLGVVLEDATPEEHARFLGAMPAPARAVWHLLGRPLYARRVRRVRR